MVNLLRDRQVLLILDNIEQVIEAAPQIADRLTGCPNQTMLATSRMPPSAVSIGTPSLP